MDFKKGKKAIIFSASLALVGILGCFFVYGRLRESEARIISIMKSFTDRQSEKVTLLSVKEKIEETASKRFQLDSYFIPTDGVVGFLNFIQSLSSSDNLRIKILSVDVAPAEEVSKDILEIVKIKMAASGSWNDVTKFAGKLETISYQMTVSRANLKFGEFSDTENETAKVSKKWRGEFDFNVLKIK